MLKADFSLKGSSLNEAKKVADTITEKEVKAFKLKAEKASKVNPIEVQVDTTLQNLAKKSLKEKCCLAYKHLSNKYQGNKKRK
ncbi:hypothetical protein WBP_0321 [Wolbachia endosymbiont of Brugia pahangi]|nr:hypothetical protein WBP_0321 [Wolbachia endosymbiont of Brugia pahangi]